MAEQQRDTIAIEGAGAMQPRCDSEAAGSIEKFRRADLPARKFGSGRPLMA